MVLGPQQCMGPFSRQCMVLGLEPLLGLGMVCQPQLCMVCQQGPKRKGKVSNHQNNG